MEVTFHIQSDNATIPCKATPQSIGLDLHSSEDYTVFPGQRLVVSTGLGVTLPNGTYGRIAPRSGIAVKHGIQVLAGVVDPDYTGEIRVVLYNTDLNTPYVIRRGYRVAQLILEQALTDVVVKVADDPRITDRSSAGFGSTGV